MLHVEIVFINFSVICKEVLLRVYFASSLEQCALQVYIHKLMCISFYLGRRICVESDFELLSLLSLRSLPGKYYSFSVALHAAGA